MLINQSSNLIPESLIVAAILFSGFTIIVPLITSYASGWQLIEKLFQTNTKSLKQDFGLHPFQFEENTLLIAVNNRKRTAGFTKIGITNNGIYLKIAFPYSLIMRPVHLPWYEIIVQKEIASENYEIVIKKLLKVRIILSPELGNKLLTFQNQKFSN